MSTAEEIAGYRVHPAASLFPLIDGKEFDDLVESIRRNGVQHPAVLHDGLLIDGRNRMNAVERLKADGVDIQCPTVEWRPDGRNLAEWIWDTNALRRHLTEDALALTSASITAMIRAESDERKKATQFTSAKASTAARARHAADTKTDPPQKRDVKKKNARSTVGQVAAKAGVSMHKARQAVAVLDAVQAGTVTPETVAEVKAGKKRLRDVVPTVASEQARPKQPPSKHRANTAAWYRILKGMTTVRNGCEVLAGNQSKRREQVAKQLRAMANHVERDGRLKDEKPEQATFDDPALMLDEISYYALAFLDACPERAGDLELLLLTWVPRCKQR
jgi:hypothetical protein